MGDGSDLTNGSVGVIITVKEQSDMADKNAFPDDFSINGWNRGNNFGLNPDDFEDRQLYRQERFKRSCAVQRAWLQTDAGRKAQSVVSKQRWEERALKAKQESDTTEVLLLEKLTSHSDGMATSELVAGCINVIARELAKRGVANVEDLELKDLILISNNLLALTKAAAAVKKDMNWKPNTVVVAPVVSSSKTGGVVGGLKDVIDIRTEKTPHAAEG